MFPAVPAAAVRVRAAIGRLILLCTLLLMLCGQAAAILGVALPAWQRPIILADTLAVGLFALVRPLLVPRPDRRHGGGRARL